MVKITLTDDFWPVLHFEIGGDLLFYYAAMPPLLSQAGYNY